MKVISKVKGAILFLLGLAMLPVQAQEQTKIWEKEAEDFDVSVAANPSQESNYPKATFQVAEDMPEGECTVSGCGFLENISANSYVVYKNVEAPEEGTYELRMYYMLADPARGVGGWANYQVRDTMWITDPTGSWDGKDAEIPSDDPENIPPTFIDGTPKMASMLIYLEKGVNTLNIGGCGNNYTPNFDRFEIYTTDKEIARPANISCSWHWDYTDEITNLDSFDDNLIKAIDNDDATFARLGKGDHIDFLFEDVPFGIAGFLMFTEYGDTLFNYNGLNAEFPGKFEVQARVNENSGWIPLSAKEVEGRGEGRVYDTDGARSTQYRGIRLQLNADDSVTIREFQLFGYPLLDSVDVEEVPGEPVSYPASLIQASIINYRTADETVDEDASNGSYVYNRPGVLNEKNNWFQGPTKAVDRKRTTKYVMENVQDFQIEWNFLVPVSAKSYGIATCAMNSDTEIKSSPASWVLEGSADFGATYDTLAVVSGFEYPVCNYINMNFPIEEEHWLDQYGMPYQFYRLSVKNGGAWKSQLSEWQLFGEPLPVVGKEDGPNLVATPQLDGVKVFSTPWGLRIRSEREEMLQYHVYELTGVEIEAGSVSGICELRLNQGAYVVKISSPNAGIYSSKAVVR